LSNTLSLRGCPQNLMYLSFLSFTFVDGGMKRIQQLIFFGDLQSPDHFISPARRSGGHKTFCIIYHSIQGLRHFWKMYQNMYMIWHDNLSDLFSFHEVYQTTYRLCRMLLSFQINTSICNR